MGKPRRFDARTGVVVGLDETGTLNNRRKEFLLDHGVVGEIRLGRDDVTVTEAGELRIAGRGLDDINAALRRRGACDLTLIPSESFWQRMGEDYARLSETGINLINPAPVPELLGDKALQYWEFRDDPVPIPPWQPLDHYVDSPSASPEADFVSDAPLVLKERTGTEAKGIWFYPGGVADFVDDWEAGTAPDAVLRAPERHVLQYAVPHRYDKRVIAAGDTPVSGEDRYGSPDTDKSNLNLVETGTESPVEAARELLRMEAVDSLDVCRLDPAVERAVGDLYDALSARTDAVDELHTWIGWDFLVVDPDSDRVRAVPDDVLDGLFRDRYRTESGDYLVFGEGNLAPGSKERYVNAIAHGRDGLKWDSAANLVEYGTAIGSDEPFEPGVPDAIGVDALADRYDL